MRGKNDRRTEQSQRLRKTDNEAEAALWLELRSRRLNGFKFVRQHGIGPFTADFACRDRNLVVEVDGSQHAGSVRDIGRDRSMNLNGWSVLRVWHSDVLNDRDAVLEMIVAALDGRLNARMISSEAKFLPAVLDKEI